MVINYIKIALRNIRNETFPGAALLIALATVTGLAVRATQANPVDALRYE